MARAIGAGLGPFNYVLTSAAPRAVETAIAMGFAVHEIVEMPSGYVPGVVEHHEQWSWPRPYLRYAELVAAEPALAAVAGARRTTWTQAIGRVADGAAALVVSHGGGIEPALVACLPQADHGSWGKPLGHCEGARLGFADGRFVSIEFSRAPRPR